MVSCLSQLVVLLVWLFLSQEGQESQRAAWVPQLGVFAVLPWGPPLGAGELA